MVSKGVDYYTYVEVSSPDFAISVTGPKVGGPCGQTNNFQQQNLQIDSKNIPGLFNYTGTLAWTASNSGNALVSGSEQISSLTGDLEGGSMGVMLSTPSTAGGGYALSYGFYDAGSGIGTELTNQDQLYVYLTEDLSGWMGGLEQAHSQQVAAAPFSSFVLAGAHDAGMFYLGTVQAILASSYAAALVMGLLTIPIIGPFLAAVTASQAPRVITNLAMTQKDSVAAMLNLGIRYFDFRPGTLYPALAAFSPGVRYHQHSMIPGYPYVQFLQDVLLWLSSNPTEIVVVSLNVQGMEEASMNPSPNDLAADLAAAFVATKVTGISVGGPSELSQTYPDLISSNIRLIFLNQIPIPPGQTDPYAASKYDSYNDSAYATLVPGPVIQAFENMTSSTTDDYVVLQMQATSTSMEATVIVPSVATLSDASSPLMCTKGGMDIATNPWILENAASNLPSDKLLILLNDFADNCTARTALAVTMSRLGIPS